MCFPEGRSFKCSAVSCKTMTHDSILHIMKTNFFLSGYLGQTVNLFKAKDLKDFTTSKHSLFTCPDNNKP